MCVSYLASRTVATASRQSPATGGPDSADRHGGGGAASRGDGGDRSTAVAVDSRRHIGGARARRDTTACVYNVKRSEKGTGPV